MNSNRRVFRVSISASDVDAFVSACGSSEWYAVDTGERIMTEEGVDAEAVLLVEPIERASVRPASALVH